MDKDRLTRFLGDVTRLSLRELSELQRALDREKLIKVAVRREERATWAEIGAELGVSTQAAHLKYSVKVAELERVRAERRRRILEEGGEPA